MIIISQTQIKIKLWHVYTLLLCFFESRNRFQALFFSLVHQGCSYGPRPLFAGHILAKIKTYRCMAYGISYQGFFESRNRLQAFFFSLVYQGWSYGPRPFFAGHIILILGNKLKHVNVWHMGPLTSLLGFFDLRSRFQA